MPDIQTIALTDLPVTLSLGVGDVERRAPQGVLISVTVKMPDPVAPSSDRLADTIDYDAIITFLQATLPREGALHLIETVADRVATHVLSLSARIETVTVTVKKPSVLPAPAMVSMTLTRQADAESRRHERAIAEPPS